MTGSRQIAGIGWTAGCQLLSAALSILSAAILSRLLSPGDFGLFAVVAPVIGLAQNLQSLGFSTAIVQARTIDKPQLNALFWTSAGLAILLTGSVVLGAPWLADAMGDPRLQDIYAVAALAILLGALAAQPQALLARALRFRDMALANLAAGLGGALLAIAIGLLTNSYWSLVVNALAVPLFVGVLSAAMVRWRPGWRSDWAAARPLMRQGFDIWLFNQCNFVARNADGPIVFRATSWSLGLYNRAYSLLVFPISRVVLPFGQVAIPSLSRAIDDAPRYRSQYWHAVTLLLLACHPILMVVIFRPVDVIRILIGTQWLEAAPLFRCFAIGGLIETFGVSLTWLLISQGRSRELARVGLATSAIALVSFLVGIRWGAIGVAAAYVIGQALLAFPLVLIVTGRMGPVRLGHIAANLAPHAMALCATAIMLAVSRPWSTGSMLADVVLATGAACLIHYAVLALFASSRIFLPLHRKLASFGSQAGGRNLI